MSDQYVGEIRMFSGNFAPQGWYFCDGSTLSINGNEMLYSVIGTTYGGDGATSFKLPDLRGRLPIHTSNSYPLGHMAGAEAVTLQQSQLPAHTHIAYANNHPDSATSNSPEGNVWGVSAGITNYQPAPANVAMSSQSLSSVGGNQSHNNMMPSVAVSFIIAHEGIYPSQG